MRLTAVTVTFKALVLLADASAARATSLRLIMETRLLWLISLKPRAPPSLLAKKTSSVSGTQIGASWAKAKPGFDATTRMDAEVPRTLVTKSGWKIWKNGGLVFVGLKNCVIEDCRKVPFSPRVANDCGLMN